ncbi:NUDIX hydrolase [Marilutibacter aestuarii]|uniref:NUDIX hydrolase n=1 Tax=Marilutibacter aestuarii TaxID=1706195 RepID=A0A508A8E7_9GAMM|nr:NUDIX hydrolase [Lysobacter aestuarii]TQD43285.1 NUDIX hydrolase [Lysobacter aestuarii]
MADQSPPWPTATPPLASQDPAAVFAEYARRWPDEQAVATQFAGLLGDSADPFVRARLAGHFTGSAWLVDASGERVLLTHHRKLGRWLQLGGHADGDRDLARVALREAQEESGLAGLVVEEAPFDLDRHWIPARGDVPGHWHYDVRYVVRTTNDERFVVSDESLALAWRDIQAIASDASSDASMARMAGKWLARMRASAR